MNLNEAIIKIRVALQNTNLKKSGKNKFAGFEYFELSDFLPTLNALMLQEGVNDIVSIDMEKATLTLVKGDERQEYSIPFVLFPTPLNSKGQASMQDIQYLGALNTYYKRYLYLNAFGITDGEVIDAMDNGTAIAKEDADKKNKAKADADLPISKAEEENLLNVLKSIKAESSMETRIKSCLDKVGVAEVSDLTVSQYNFLIKMLARGAK